MSIVLCGFPLKYGFIIVQEYMYNVSTHVSRMGFRKFSLMYKCIAESLLWTLLRQIKVS